MLALLSLVSASGLMQSNFCNFCNSSDAPGRSESSLLQSVSKTAMECAFATDRTLRKAVAGHDEVSIVSDGVAV